MSKRLMSLNYSEVEKLNSRELLEAIALSEGRILVGECVCSVSPLLNDITNAEVVAALSADIVTLNVFDVDNPYIAGLGECEKSETVHKLKKLIGRPVAINLEPCELTGGDEKLWTMSKGRLANAQNARKAKEMGVDILVITGNPGNHVTNESICEAIKEIRAELGEDIILVTGKMHGSGSISESGANIIDRETIDMFAECGADIIMIPSPGTIPGIDQQKAHQLIEWIHACGKLAMTAMGTSQEGSDTDTIKQIALMSKMAGADIHHIGDSGYVGMALPENIFAYSIAIRGARHTYHKIGQSVNR